MNRKNKILFIAIAAVISVFGGAVLGFVSTRRAMPVETPTAAEITSGTAAETQSVHESYTDEQGETITFPVPDGTLPVQTQAQTRPETQTTKKSFFDLGKKETSTVSKVITTVKTTASTKAPSTSEKTAAPSQTASKTAAAAGKIPDYEYAYAGFDPSYAQISSSNWNLLLVNRDYILPDDYVPQLAPSITNDQSSCKLDYRVAPHYNEMYLAAKADGIILTPVSGYRSLSRQRNNLNNKIAYYENQGYDKVTATQKAAERILPPGTSEHNAGMAMDIITADSTAGFQFTKEYKWLEEHAADYGFILRYPENKQNITKIIYEPWHWRYVGVDAARAMKASGQCLEEYLGKA